ncbi:MAG: hypothetical protein CM15mP71_5940 [Candidatus Poseidoniales archaeon]|nr:MAG: hypothetical protein CM15mP71_5940 [Candidatus Poseidoniales archaeon]
MESPELTAERIIKREFTTTEIILRFVVSVATLLRWFTPVPVPSSMTELLTGPIFAQVDEIVPTGEKWQGSPMLMEES